MPTIGYEVEEGIFFLDLGDGVEALKNLDTDESRELIEFLKSKAVDTVKIPQDKYCFPYGVLKLLDDGKGAPHSQRVSAHQMKKGSSPEVISPVQIMHANFLISISYPIAFQKLFKSPLSKLPRSLDSIPVPFPSAVTPPVFR
jgi:hypothetical protein